MMSQLGSWFRQAFSSSQPNVPQAGVSSLLTRNAALKDSQAGRACVILGNGMSVRTLDLTRLKDCDVISISTGYFHHGYDQFQPRFHCLPQLTYGKMTRELAVAWFKEMDERLFGSTVFLSTTEAELVSEYGLFAERQVHYLEFQNDFDDWPGRHIIDIAAPVPRIMSSPIMALMIVMYMGYTKICLLGFDHDQLKTGLYGYPYSLGVTKGADPSVGRDNKNISSKYDDFHALAQLWRQYRTMKQIAERNGVTIVNASAESELDEFERISFEQALIEFRSA